jgi:hypothetical protein
MVPSDLNSSLAHHRHARYCTLQSEEPVFRLSAPQQSLSPTAGLTLPGSPQLSSARGRLLVTAFRSPTTAPAYAVSIPGSTFLACYFAPARSLDCPFGLSAPLPSPVRPGFGRFIASGPLQFRYADQQTALTVSTPLRGFCPPPDQSVPPLSPLAGPPSESARSPFAPRSPSYF